jgi:putative membrane protein
MMKRNRWLGPALAGSLLATPAWAGDDMGTGAASTDGSATGTGAASVAATSTPSKKLLDGVQRLHAANEAEVQMGQVGTQSAQDARVRQFAQMMVDDHSRNDQQLTLLAQTMGAELTGKAYQEKQQDARKAMGKVQGKTGAEFDRAFMAQMTKDHEKETKEVRTLADQAREGGQAELAAFLDTTHQAMQQHLTMARQVEDGLKSGGTAAAGGAAAEEGTGAGQGVAGEDESNTQSAADPTSKSAGSINPDADEVSGTGSSAESTPPAGSQSGGGSSFPTE